MINEKQIKTYFFKNELNMENIINDYYNYISKIIKNSTNISIEDEEEIISDVIFIVWKNKDKLDKTLSLTPYIAGITKKVIYKKYNSSLRDLGNFMDYQDDENDYVSDFNVENLIEEKELNDYILNSLQKASLVDADIFRKFYFEDKSINQISKETGISKSNVKTKLHRTRKKVKELLKLGGF